MRDDVIRSRRLVGMVAALPLLGKCRVELGGGELPVGEDQPDGRRVGIAGVGCAVNEFEAELAGDHRRGGVGLEQIRHDRQFGVDVPGGGDRIARDRGRQSPPLRFGKTRHYCSV